MGEPFGKCRKHRPCICTSVRSQANGLSSIHTNLLSESCPPLPLPPPPPVQELLHYYEVLICDTSSYYFSVLWPPRGHSSNRIILELFLDITTTDIVTCIDTPSHSLYNDLPIWTLVSLSSHLSVTEARTATSIHLYRIPIVNIVAGADLMVILANLAPLPIGSDLPVLRLSIMLILHNFPSRPYS